MLQKAERFRRTGNGCLSCGDFVLSKSPSVLLAFARTSRRPGHQTGDQKGVISPDFPLESTGIFPGKHLIHFLVLKMKDFWIFVLDNCILNFDAEQ